MLENFDKTKVTSVMLLSSKEATEASLNMLSPWGKAVAAATAREALQMLGERPPDDLGSSRFMQEAFERGCGLLAAENDLDLSPKQIARELPSEMGHEFDSAINVGASIAYHNAKSAQIKGVLGAIGKIGLIGLGVATGIWLG